MPAPDLAMAQQVLTAQPFSTLLGARIAAFDTGSARLELDLDPDLTQQFGYAHGGVLAYLADNAVTFAAGSVLGPDVVTSGVAIEYLRPARTGPLVADALVEVATTRHAVCRVTISCPEGTVAVGQGRVSVRSETATPLPR